LLENHKIFHTHLYVPLTVTRRNVAIALKKYYKIVSLMWYGEQVCTL